MNLEKRTALERLRQLRQDRAPHPTSSVLPDSAGRFFGFVPRLALSALVAFASLPPGDTYIRPDPKIQQVCREGESFVSMDYTDEINNGQLTLRARLLKSGDEISISQDSINESRERYIDLITRYTVITEQYLSDMQSGYLPPDRDKVNELTQELEKHEQYFREGSDISQYQLKPEERLPEPAVFTIYRGPSKISTVYISAKCDDKTSSE